MTLAKLELGSMDIEEAIRLLMESRGLILVNFGRGDYTFSKIEGDPTDQKECGEWWTCHIHGYIVVRERKS